MNRYFFKNSCNAITLGSETRPDTIGKSPGRCEGCKPRASRSLAQPLTAAAVSSTDGTPSLTIGVSIQHCRVRAFIYGGGGEEKIQWTKFAWANFDSKTFDYFTLIYERVKINAKSSIPEPLNIFWKASCQRFDSVHHGRGKDAWAGAAGTHCLRGRTRSPARRSGLASETLSIGIHICIYPKRSPSQHRGLPLHEPLVTASARFNFKLWDLVWIFISCMLCVLSIKISFGGFGGGVRAF